MLRMLKGHQLFGQRYFLKAKFEKCANGLIMVKQVAFHMDNRLITPYQTRTHVREQTPLALQRQFLLGMFVTGIAQVQVSAIKCFVAGWARDDTTSKL